MLAGVWGRGGGKGEKSDKENMYIHCKRSNIKLSFLRFQQHRCNFVELNTGCDSAMKLIAGGYSMIVLSLEGKSPCTFPEVPQWPSEHPPRYYYIVKSSTHSRAKISTTTKNVDSERVARVRCGAQQSVIT